MKGKTYLIVLDGGADRAMAALGDRTAFDAARTPHLDQLARCGQQGLLTIIDATICPESDNGSMALLSYDPLKYYTGRGPLEGLGAGFLDSSRYHVSFRLNFASYDSQRETLDRRTARDLTDPELQTLAQEVRDQVVLSAIDGIAFELMAFNIHRGILGLRSDTVPLSGHVNNTDPGFRKQGPFGIPVADWIPKPLPCRPLDDSEAARNVAVLIDEFVAKSSQVLRNSEINKRRVDGGLLPANVFLLRDGGAPPMELIPFAEKFGRSLSAYGQIPAEKGLARLLGATFRYSWMQGATSIEQHLGDICQQLIADDSDVVFAHIEGPDEPGHDGKPHDKVASIETIDEHLIGPLMRSLGDHDICIVTCDHATPCDVGIHTADPVPTVVAGTGLAPDDTVAFGESQAARGRLPPKRAIDLLPYVFATKAV